MPTIHHGDCIEVMNAMPAESVDAIVTDPPYGLSFMQAKWDATPPGVQWAEACYRVLKPGGHIVAFGGTRTWHRLAVAIEDAGFEMRDSLAWLYGSGFPKSLDVSKAIDKEANRRDLFEPIRAHIREWRDRNGMSNADLNAAVGSKTNGCGMARHWTSTEGGQHAIPSKAQWANLKGVLGWLDCELDELYASVKDGAERPVIGTHKIGLVTGTAGVGGGGAGGSITAPATPEAEQWDGWGTALKPAFEPIVLARKPFPGTVAANVLEHGTGAINVDACRIAGEVPSVPQPDFKHVNGAVTHLDAHARNGQMSSAPSGRWPANVVLDQHAAAWVDEQSGVLKSGGGDKAPRRSSWFTSNSDAASDCRAPDSGGASRFFYTAKAPKRERPNVDGVQHPTVKPLAIMQWLLRLVTPPGGTVLDPFAGSGTTIEAALIEGFNPVGIEMEADYLPLIQHRIDRQAAQLAV